MVPVTELKEMYETMVTYDLSFDHRVVDGADAARFRETLAAYTESAERFGPDG